MKNAYSSTQSVVTKTLSIALVMLINVVSVSGVKGEEIVTNVPDIKAAHLSDSYWLSTNPTANAVLLDLSAINRLNKDQFTRQTYLTAPLSLPSQLSGTEVKAQINQISRIPQWPRFYPDGTRLTTAHFQHYIDNMALARIKDNHTIKFGIVTTRSALRTFPTADRVLNEGMAYDLDRFQESAVFPGEPVAVLHTSKDGKWYFIQNYHYGAWVNVNAVALAPKSDIASFIGQSDKLVVTGAKVFTTYNPTHPELSEVQLDMGIALPLMTQVDLNTHDLYGQNPYASYIVQLPTRTAQGQLAIKLAFIPRAADVSVGYLPLTANNIVKQAFKFLGERYGWGHDYNARDCSGFVGEIYKSFGLLLPRNTSQQANDPVGINFSIADDASYQDRENRLSSLKVGDLIYLPGHVAMFLGYDQGQPYIIHDVHGMGYTNEKGDKVSGVLNGVSVTPLLPFQSYVQRMHTIKRIQPE